MFQPARPLEMWSRVANARARVKGSEYVVEAVAISPIRSVRAAIAASSRIGSRASAARFSTLPVTAGMSAKKMASKAAASARAAMPA